MIDAGAYKESFARIVINRVLASVASGRRGAMEKEQPRRGRRDRRIEGGGEDPETAERLNNAAMG